MNRKFYWRLVFIVVVLITSITGVNIIHTKENPGVVTNDVTKQSSSEVLPDPEKEPTGQQTSSKDFQGGTSPSPPVEEGYQANTAKQAPGEKTDLLPVSKSQTAVIQSNSTPVSRSVEINNSYPKLSKNQGIYGQFSYREAGGGRIQIDPQWVSENIVTITLPGLNRQVQVNKAAKDKFIKAFTYIKNGTATINGKEVPLLSLIKSVDGTFVTRHVNWNPTAGLSNHSWGTAIDINAANHFGYVDPGTETNDPNLILWEKAFKPAGFSWGNSYGDSMHFELLK